MISFNKYTLLNLQPKEEERGGEDSKGAKKGEGGGDIGNSEGTLKLEQQPRKPKSEETVYVKRRQEILPEAGCLGEGDTEKEEEDEEPSTDETEKRERYCPRQCKTEETTERGDKTRLKKADESTGEAGQVGNVYWGVTRGELPPAVSACFEDPPSLLARLQGRLLSLLGRNNRWVRMNWR